MELLQQELNNPSSPRPPPLPPRPPISPDPRAMTLPSMHSASAPTLMTSATGSTAMSRSPSNQSALSLADDRDVAVLEGTEPRYVSAPQRPRPHKSAASAASQLLVNSRRRGLDRARTCEDSSAADTPPALPPPRKFSLPFDLVGETAGLQAARSRFLGQSPATQQQQQQQQLRYSPDPPSTSSVTTDRSPRSSPHSPYTKHA